jgi:hypothetical protein
MTLDDRELDEILRVTRARFVARTDADFDFDAGLADVYERAGLSFARVPARPRGGGPDPLLAAVALACANIEEFVVVLSSGLLSAGPLPDLVGSHVQRAADVLLGLRHHLAAGTLSAGSAEAAINSVRDALGQADLILRVEVGSSLDAESWLRRIDHRVSLAVAEQAPPPAVRPRPVSRARRREGGQSRDR